jgi:hypothetical protein
MAVELMIAHALIYADEKYYFKEIIENLDMDRYAKLTDHIITEIEYAENLTSPVSHLK